jgi:DNA-binding NarL/FixJ family response regulator
MILGSHIKTPTQPGPTVLSKRQQEILEAACTGAPDKAIAADLGVSPRTLEGHWRAIHQKLGTTNRCQAGYIFAAMRENPQGKILA